VTLETPAGIVIFVPAAFEVGVIVAVTASALGAITVGAIMGGTIV
jgi:hypothetical protein